ncbi:MAG: hypothetical protein U1F36_11960 [Planctomycetota bacterium]
MRRSTLFVLPALLCATGLSAQSYFYLPAGHDALEGNTNNTIPFWSTSATYQQVHDGTDVDRAIGGGFALIQSLNFRKDNATTPIPARTIDVQITLGQTPVTAASASGTYASNLGAAPVVVVPYTTFNLPSLTASSVPNPIGWSFPFATSFPYLSGNGNLCWEMRTMNSSINSSASLDAGQGNSVQASGVIGTGCQATGQAAVAQISTRSLNVTSGAWRNVMTFGAITAPSVLLIGVGAVHIPLPGYCSALELSPIASITGVTDAAGQLDITYTFGSLIGQPGVQLLGQYAFVDVGLPGGVGLSNASSYTLAPRGNGQTSRIYTAPSGGGAGNETSLSGSVGRYFGLVTIFGM